MPDINVTIVLPSGGARTAEVPDDVNVKELMPEFTSLLELPTTGPDGRAMTYRLDSKALGRELNEDETLAAAGIPQNDRLMLTADITAGAEGSNVVAESPRMRRLKADYELMTDLAARTNMWRIADLHNSLPRFHQYLQRRMILHEPHNEPARAG